jgi:hypothetical protein
MSYGIIAVCALVVSLMPWTALAKDQRAFTEQFWLGKCQSKARADNPYYTLKQAANGILQPSLS